MTAIAFFDFDGTISKTDSMLRFLLFTVPPRKILTGALKLLPTLALLLPNIKTRSEVKQQIFITFFAGVDHQELKWRAEAFADTYIKTDLRSDALRKINWHLDLGHKVVIVSASPELWIQPISMRLGLSFIATKLELCNGTLTGRLDGKNCVGAEKVSRIKKEYDLSQFSSIFAYGDSAGDYELLRLAVNNGYRVFNK